MFQLSLSDSASPESAGAAFFAQQGVTGQYAAYQSNGLRGVRGQFSAATQNGTLTGHAAFVTYGGRVYQLLGYGTPDGWQTYGSGIQASAASLRQLTDVRALNIRANRIEVVQTDRAMTITSFNTR